MSEAKHTPGPWVVDKAKWAACQWGTMPDDARGEPNCAGGVLPVIAAVLCPENDDHDLCVRSRREDQQDRIAWTDEERWSNAMLIAAAPDLLAACKEAEFLAAHGVGAVNTSKDPDCVANAQRNLDECIRIQKILRAAIAKAGGAA